MNWITDILPEAVLTLIGGASGWFFGRKREKQSTKSIELDNVQSAIAIWRESAESLAQEVSDIKDSQEELIKKNKELTYHVEKLEKKVQELTAENRKLRERLEQNS